MVFIPESSLTDLLNAVPSFKEQWRASEERDAEYARKYPEEAQTPEERVNDFLGQLAYHLGRRVAAGELREVERLAAALERLYARSSEEEAVVFTIGFLESLVYGTEYAGGDPSTISPVMTGPRTRWRWRQAFAYTKEGTYLYDQGPEQSEPSTDATS